MDPEMVDMDSSRMAAAMEILLLSLEESSTAWRTVLVWAFNELDILDISWDWEFNAPEESERDLAFSLIEIIMVSTFWANRLNDLASLPISSLRWSGSLLLKSALPSAISSIRSVIVRMGLVMERLRTQRTIPMHRSTRAPTKMRLKRRSETGLRSSS